MNFRRASFPLSAMFLLMAVVGVICGLLSPVLRDLANQGFSRAHTISVSLVSSLVVMIISGIIGLQHVRQGRGLAWGILVGVAVGAALGPVSQGSFLVFRQLVVLSLVGAGLLIGIGIVFVVKE